MIGEQQSRWPYDGPNKRRLDDHLPKGEVYLTDDEAAQLYDPALAYSEEEAEAAGMYDEVQGP